MASKRPTYQELSRELSSRVTRWAHTSFAVNQLEPFMCERNGWKPGRPVKKATEKGYSYGFAENGQLLIAREGQFEYLHIHEPGAISRIQYDRSAIAWARRQNWGEEEQKKEARAKGSAELELVDGRVTRVEVQWPGQPARVDEYEYDESGRLVRVRVSEPAHEDILFYDEKGELTRVVWRAPSGEESERFTRAPPEDSLALLLPALQKKLIEQIPRVLAEAKIRAPAYCLAVSCNLEEAPNLLPPKLTLGLVEHREEHAASRGEIVQDEIWNPEGMPTHDDERLVMRDEALLALCKRANVAREDDRPIIVMLRKVAAELQTRGLFSVLDCTPEFLIYALDVGGESAATAALKAAPRPIAKKLRAAKLL